MNFIELVHPYLNFFYLLGQTLYPPGYYLHVKRRTQPKWDRYSLMIPTILMLFVKLVICVTHAYLINFYDETYIRSADIVSNVDLFCEVVKLFAILYQNFVYPKLFREILQNFRSVELLFQNSLNRPILFTSFKRNYSRKMRWAFGAYAFMMIVFVAYYIRYGQITLSDLLLQIMKFLSVCVYMNVLFFIDLIPFHIKHLNTIVAKESSDSDANSMNIFVVKKVHTALTMVKQLSKYKLIHFHLWKITEQLNECFGWTLLAITLQSCVEMVIFTIWQLRVLSDLWKLMRLTRNIIMFLIDSSSIFTARQTFQSLFFTSQRWQSA